MLAIAHLLFVRNDYKSKIVLAMSNKSQGTLWKK
jgi:hypothetical protein